MTVLKDKEKIMPPNHLIHEKSPYLIQHAHNPVDWHPWSDDTFARAKMENKPIFLSIGYATCHWCHVMEKESFEDQEAAEYLNDTFVCIKVDREERPDIDAVYMAACQMLTGSGGWPLSIFMTPQKKPFFAATYLPKNSRAGRAGLIDICRHYPNLEVLQLADNLINDTAVRKAVTKEARSDNALNRELNLTWTTKLQEDNNILTGRWWQPDDTGKPVVSVESKLAERMGITMGDEL